MLRNTARSVTRTLTLTNARLPVPRTLRLYSQQEQNPNIPPPAYSEYQWYETQKFRYRRITAISTILFPQLSVYMMKGIGTHFWINVIGLFTLNLASMVHALYLFFYGKWE